MRRAYRKSRGRSQRYAEKLDLDPAQLARSNNASRFSKRSKRKYGGSIAEVIAFGERAAERMRKIEGRDAELERLAAEIDEHARGNAARRARRLRKLRAKAAPKLSENIRRNLRDLGFRQSEFEAKLDALTTSRGPADSMQWSCFFRRIRANR